jgi:hypothetical protein
MESKFMKNKAVVVLSSMLFSASAFAANVTGYEISPAQVISGQTRVIQLLEDYDDGSKVDVTANYNFSYAGNDGAIKVSALLGKAYLMGVKSGSFPIHAASKTTSASSDSMISIQPSGASKIVYVSGSSQKAIVGDSFPQPLVVKAVDNYLNPISGLQIKFTVKSGDATVGQSVVTTGADGTASEPLTAGLTWGPITVSADAVAPLPAASSVAFNLTSTTNANADDASALVFIVPAIRTQISGVPFNDQLSVQVRNANGMPVADATGGSITIGAYSNSSCTYPAASALSGGTVSAPILGNSASFFGLVYNGSGTIYIKAQSGNLSPACSKAIVVASPMGQAAKLIISALPSKGIQGSPLFPGFKVEEQDSKGILVSSAMDTISLQAYSDAACSANVATSNASGSAAGGIASINGVIANASGNLFFKARTASGLVSQCAGAVQVDPNSADVIAKMSFLPFQQAEIQNIQLAQGLSVKAMNAHGDVISSGMPSISLAAFADPTCSTASPGFNLASASSVANKGVASFSNVYFSAAGTYYIKATAPNGVSTCSTPVVVSAPATTQAAQIALGGGSTAPAATAVAGVPMPEFQIQALTSSGSLATSKAVYVTVQAYKDSRCKIVADEMVRVSEIAQNGVAKFHLTFKKAETVYLGIVGERLLPVCSTAIVVSPAPADKIQIVSGDNQDGSSTNVLRSQAVVKVIDAFGNPIPNMTITWAAVTGGGSFKSETSTTDSNGQASNTFIAGGILGSESYSATNATIASIQSVVFHANISESGGGGFISSGGDFLVEAKSGGTDSVAGGTSQSSADGSVSIDLDAEHSSTLAN